MEINGAALRAIRRASRRTQVSLATDCEVTQGHIASIEQGRHSASDELAHRLASSLGIDDLRAIQHAPGPDPIPVERTPL